FFQPDGDLDHQENEDGKGHDPDPKSLGFDIFEILAPGDQSCVFHRNPASFASGPTNCTNTSCKVGSDWLKLRRRIRRSKQNCRIDCGSAFSRTCNSHCAAPFVWGAPLAFSTALTESTPSSARIGATSSSVSMRTRRGMSRFA